MGILMRLPFLLPLFRLYLLLPVTILGFSLCAWFRVLLYAPIFRQLEEKKKWDDCFSIPLMSNPRFSLLENRGFLTSCQAADKVSTA